MEDKILVKSMLHVYKHLEALTLSLEKMAKNKGVGSYYSYDDTLKEINNILTLTERKIFLINLKVLIDEIILSLDKELGKLLVLKYVDELDNDAISVQCNLTERTFFRQLNRAYDGFCKKLQVVNKERPNFYNQILNDSWLNAIIKFLTKDVRQSYYLKNSTLPVGRLFMECLNSLY